MTSSGNSIAAGQLDARHSTEQVSANNYTQLSSGRESFPVNDKEGCTSEFQEGDTGSATDSEDESEGSAQEEKEGKPSFNENQAASFDEDTGYISEYDVQSELSYDTSVKKILYDDGDVVQGVEITAVSATEFADSNPDWVDEYLSDNSELVLDHLNENPALLRDYLDSHQELILEILNNNPDSVCMYLKTVLCAAKTTSPDSHQTSVVAPIYPTKKRLSPAKERARAVGGDGTYPYPASEVSRSRIMKPTDGSNGWRKYEEDAAIRYMLDIREEKSIKGEDRFREVSRRLAAEGIDRTWGGVKNYWNRTGRLRSGFDERSKKTAELATSKQGKAAKEKEDAENLMEKKEKKKVLKKAMEEAEQEGNKAWESAQRKRIGGKRKADEAELDEAVIQAAQNGTRNKKMQRTSTQEHVRTAQPSSAQPAYVQSTYARPASPQPTYADREYPYIQTSSISSMTEVTVMRTD